jgi:hypothetical protein
MKEKIEVCHVSVKPRLSSFAEIFEKKVSQVF